MQLIEEAVKRKLPESEWLLLTGSLPPNVPPDFYARLIHLAHDHKVSALLDASGEALRLGLQAKPEIAKPNRPEAERLLDRTLLSQQQTASAVIEIQRMGPQWVILSLGSQGAVAASEEQILRAVPPPIQTRCPIGAGDVLSATCVWRLSCRDSFPEAFRWAVAAATAAAAKPGLTFAPLPEVEQMLPQVEMRSV
jgi:fructose-1-phosphate kinase PfkB-like protein